MPARLGVMLLPPFDGDDDDAYAQRMVEAARRFGQAPWQLLHIVCDPYHEDSTWRFPLIDVSGSGLAYRREQFEVMVHRSRESDPALLRMDIREELLDDLSPLLERSTA